jgi:hypothetical protein
VEKTVSGDVWKTTEKSEKSEKSEKKKENKKRQFLHNGGDTG